MNKFCCLIFLALCSLPSVLSNDTPLPDKEKDATRIMAFNIRTARGMDDKTDYERTANVIINSKADFIALQEVDNNTGRSGKTDQAKKLAELTGMEYEFAEAIPYQGGSYGIAILSREKPVKTERLPLPGKEKRVMLVAEYDQFILCCTHFDLTKEARISSAKTANEIAGKSTKPVILAGDLNAHPSSETITELNKQWKLLSNDKLPTYPANTPRETLDYIFISKKQSPSFKLNGNGVINEPEASDHRPVYIDIKMK